MPRVLLFLAILILVATAVALIDCLSVERAEIRRLPRLLWAVIIVLLPILGPAAWYSWGRARRWPPPTHDHSATGHPSFGGTGGRAPDDDPEFLAALARRTEQERARRLRDEQKPAPEQPDDTGNDRDDHTQID